VKLVVVGIVLAVGFAPPVWADDSAALRALAEEGDAAAQFALGTMYRDGRGMDQDYAEALRWWQSAAEQGLVDAQYALGNIYAGGSGVAKDPIMAYMWYGIAALQTGSEWLHEIAASNRDALAARMSPADIAKAQERVTEWQAKHGR